MNKRALISLAVVPVILASAMVWARKAAHERLEDSLRSDILADMESSFRLQGQADFPVCVWRLQGAYPSYPDVLGGWNESKMKQFLSDVHLQKTPQFADNGPFYSCFYGDSAPGIYYGPQLNVKADTGYITFSNPKLTSKWNPYRLTPESCRTLKKRIWSQFGPKLRALHIAPPR